MLLAVASSKFKMFNLHIELYHIYLKTELICYGSLHISLNLFIDDNIILLVFLLHLNVGPLCIVQSKWNSILSK